jgi:23S rRNA pseudouridine1911/1915/1917 synthase
VSPIDRWRVPAEAAGDRLDRYLAEHYETPRNRVQAWIREGRVEVAGAAARASQRLSAGEEVACEPRAIQQPADLRPEEGALEILHEDPSLVVVAKPAGLVVHPGAGRESGTLVHRLLARYPEIAQVGGPGRPGIVHRLDRDTTGVLLVARTDAAYQALSAAFAERRIEKSYQAIAYGAPRPASGVLDGPIARHPRRRKEMAVVASGRPARTLYETLASASGLALLHLGLETGRTHQIRVHLKAAGHPLVGDPVYGEARWKGLTGAARGAAQAFPRPALHAWRIAFEHPRPAPASVDWVSYEAPIPEDLRELWRVASGADWPPPPAPLRSTVRDPEDRRSGS